MRHDVGMGRLFLLIVLANLALLVIALIDCLSSEENEIRALPKLVWVLLILLFSPLGPIAWLFAGRPVSAVRGSEPGGWAGGGAQAARGRPVAPDDDPEFLASLSKKTKEDERLLRMWEADLQRREEELRRERGERDETDQDGGDPDERGQGHP